MENGLKNILKKKNKIERKNIPQKIINDDFFELPDKIRVVFCDTININHINSI